MSHLKIAKTLDELPSFDDMIGMSGLDFMRSILEGKIAGPPIAETLNFTLNEVEISYQTFILRNNILCSLLEKRTMKETRRGLICMLNY